jgi:Na+-transporting methylmalonyl-CoA/oxaloacetate decarboxylase gamma subunit
MNNSYTVMDAVGDILVIYGIVIVVSMLVALVIHGIVWALSRQAKDAVKPVVKPAAAPQPILAGVPQEHLAVISAAVAAMLGAHRIVRIEAPSRGYSWTAEARSVHHTSHVPRASH